MKGRGNDKPAAKYHPYIVALLKSKYVNGIIGGGYLPDHNFKLDDLPPDQAEELLNLKPVLGSPRDLFEKEGMTERTLARIESGLSNNSLDMGKYEPEENRFIVEEWNDFEKFLGSVYDDTVEKLLELADGTVDGTADASFEDFETTVLAMPSEWQNKFAHKAGIIKDDLSDDDIIEATRILFRSNDDYWLKYVDFSKDKSNEAWGKT